MTAIDRYFENLQKLLQDVLSTQADAMEQAAQCAVQTLQNGGMLYTFGTGHGHLLALEIFYRAGGPAKVTPILDEALMLHKNAAGSTLEERKEDWADRLLQKYPIRKGDMLFVFSNSGRNAAPVLLADAARRRGATVCAVTNLRHSSASSPRNRLGRRLYELSDIVLDNRGEVGDAALFFADGSRVGPTSTAVGAAMVQAIVCRMKELALENGADIEFFVSSNVDGGDDINEKLLQKYGNMIPGLCGKEPQ